MQNVLFQFFIIIGVSYVFSPTYKIEGEYGSFPINNKIVHNILSMNIMKTINSMKRDITGNTKSKMAGETEHARLGYALPVEVEMLIKEYAQPRYRASAHFKAMNTLFVYQKRGLMPIFLGLACPECDHPLLQTRLNVKYRKAQIMYRKRQLGEIYDDFVHRIPTLVDHESFKHDMLRCSRNLRFVTDELGRPIETNSSPMNCTDIYCEIATSIVIVLPLLTVYALPISTIFASYIIVCCLVIMSVEHIIITLNMV